MATNNKDSTSDGPIHEKTRIVLYSPLSESSKEEEAPGEEEVVVEQPEVRYLPWCSNLMLYLLLFLLMLCIIFAPKYRYESDGPGGYSQGQIWAAHLLWNLQKEKADRMEDARWYRLHGDFNFMPLLVGLLCLLAGCALILFMMKRRLRKQQRKSVAFWIFTVLAIAFGFFFTAYTRYMEAMIPKPKPPAQGMSVGRKLLLLLFLVLGLVLLKLFQEHQAGKGPLLRKIEEWMGIDKEALKSEVGSTHDSVVMGDEAEKEGAAKVSDGGAAAGVRDGDSKSSSGWSSQEDPEDEDPRKRIKGPPPEPKQEVSGPEPEQQTAAGASQPAAEDKRAEDEDVQVRSKRS